MNYGSDGTLADLERLKNFTGVSSRFYPQLSDHH